MIMEAYCVGNVHDLPPLQYYDNGTQGTQYVASVVL